MAAASSVREVYVTGVISPVTAEIIAGAIAQANAAHDAALIIRLDTPGGLMEAMRKCDAEIEASKTPVISFVAPRGARAASAGFFLLEAADVAAMSPGTNTGAAHPVIAGTQMDPVMKEKLENDAAAGLRGLITRDGQRERNAVLAESAVRESKSFTAQEALQGHLIEIVARDEADLLRQLDGRGIERGDGAKVTLHVAGAAIVPYELTLRQRALEAVSDPNVALVLFAIGVLAIYVEFAAPGLIFPGVIGSVMALIGLAALSVLPLNWLGVLLVALALAMFALELKVMSHGVLSVGGAVSLVLGAMMLVDGPIPEMRIHPLTAFAVATPIALIMAMLVTLAVRARRNKVVTGAEGMIGLSGVALEDLAPRGRVMVHGENWLALSVVAVPRGTAVRVRAVEDLLLEVEPKEPYVHA